MTDSEASDSEASKPDSLACCLCLNLLCEPVHWPATTGSPCQHVFCRLCTFKCLRASVEPACPLCREPACDESHGAAASDLVLARAKSEEVLQTFALEHSMLLAAHSAELTRLQADEDEFPLYVIGAYTLRPGQKVQLKMKQEHLGSRSVVTCTHPPSALSEGQSDDGIDRRGHQPPTAY